MIRPNFSLSEGFARYANFNIHYTIVVKAEVQDIDVIRKNVEVTLSSSEVAAEEMQLIRDLQRVRRIPGFRSGKAPEKLIRNRFAKVIREELKKRVVSKAHKEGLADADFKVFLICDVDVTPETPQANEESIVKFTVDSVPEFELPAYEGLKVKNQSTEVNDREVNDFLKNILKQKSQFNPVERAAERGDYVHCSYEGRIGEELVADMVPDSPVYGTQKNTWEEAGSEDGLGVAAVVSGLIGMKKGDAKEVSMEFPEDFNLEPLAGKTAVYSLEVKEVQERVAPEMNEAFFKSLEVKDEAELRERISGNVEVRKKRSNAEAARSQVIRHLLEAVDFPLPESGVESEREQVVRNFVQQNVNQGVQMETMEKDKESIYEKAEEIARNQLKLQFILSKIAEKQEIRISQEESGRTILAEARKTGQDPKKLVKELQKDSEKRNRLYQSALLQKALDFVLEKADYEEVKPTAS